MYTSLATYDWQAAKRHFDESGITKVPGQIKAVWDRNKVDDFLLSPFKRMGHLLIGLKKLADPSLEKELNKAVDRINSIQEKIENRGKPTQTQIHELKSAINKFVKLAKKSGNENAIQDAKRTQEDFKRMFERYK